MTSDTIVALSTGHGRAALAIIRLSGTRVRFVIETILQAVLTPRSARLVTVRHPASGETLDRCIALWFAAPASATGEDVLELHVHGGVAVVRGVLRMLAEVSGIRLAEPGEFSRRALENGKLDLLQVEALGDLLNAETSGQLAQAQRQMSGELGRRVLDWRDRIVSIRAVLEAVLDFADEGDVADGVSDGVVDAIGSLLVEVRSVLGQAERGRRIRDGAKVAIVGRPNVGKSLLMNALAGRDVAIVSDTAGTTRDLLEAPLELSGIPVVLVDSAGLRESADAIEREGVERARRLTLEADVILDVRCSDIGCAAFEAGPGATVIRVGSKVDLAPIPDVDVEVSAVSGQGLEVLRMLIGEALRGPGVGDAALVSRERQRAALSRVEAALERAMISPGTELMAEDLRHASGGLSALVGHTDYETVLDALFEGFCIGK